jgi:hypothetical protein
MIEKSRAVSAQAAKRISLPAELVDAARIKAKASGLALDDPKRRSWSEDFMPGSR